MRRSVHLFFVFFFLQIQLALANDNRGLDLFVYLTDFQMELIETADGLKKIEPRYYYETYDINVAALIGENFGPSAGPLQNRFKAFNETFGISTAEDFIEGFTQFMGYIVQNPKFNKFRFKRETPRLRGDCYSGNDPEEEILVLLRADAESAEFAPIIAKCIRNSGSFQLAKIIKSENWLKATKDIFSANLKIREFGALFSPPLSKNKVQSFFSFGVTNGEELEDVLNRMNADNFTQATEINEDVLLDFLRYEAAGKKEGLSAKAFKDKKRAEKIASQKRAEERAKKLAAARERIEVMPVAVCIGGNKKGQTQTLVNLFNSNNTPAAASYMLDVGCNNRWATKIRGGDLKEFYRYGGYVGVHTKEFMSGIGWIYAVIRASDWDVPIN